MTLFAVGTLLSWRSSSFNFLLGSRILQALGSGLLLQLTQVAAMTMYPVEKQGTVMGIFGLASGAAPVIAPTLAGILISFWGWRIIFLITLIFALITIAISLFTVRKTHIQNASFDLSSLILCTLGLSNLNMVGILIGVIIIAIFVRRQLKLKEPFLDLRTLVNRNFRLAVIISMLLYFVMMGGSTVFPILIQTVMKKSAVTSALVMLPGSLAMTLINPLTGRFFDRDF